MNTAYPQFLLWLGQLPVFLICLAGIVLGFVWWRRHPMVSLWAVLGFGCLLMSRTASLVGFSLLPWLMNAAGWGNPDIRAISIFTSFVSSLLSAAGLGMLAVALFGWRHTGLSPK
jgi:hypothetical protein